MSENNDENLAHEALSQQRQAQKGTIFFYFNNNKDGDAENNYLSTEGDATTATPPEEPPSDHQQPQNSTLVKSRQQDFFRYVSQRELGGKLCSRSSAALHHHYSREYTEVNTLNLHRRGLGTLTAPHANVGTTATNTIWGANATTTAGPSYDVAALMRSSNWITCAEFDSEGQLLLTGDTNGFIAVHDAGCVVNAAASYISLTESDLLRPHVSISVGGRSIQSVAWNPANDVEIGVACVGRGEVKLYDLEYTRGEPKQVFRSPQAAGSIGVFDPAFFGNRTTPSAPSSRSQTGYTLAAGGPNGCVYLWDKRTNGTVATTLQSTQSGPPIISVQLAEADRLIIAGTATGEVKFWDVRGGSGGALRFGGVVCPHPVLGSIRLDTALHSVPGLVEHIGEGGIIPSGVRSLRVDPVDPRRLGFHLNWGWSGVYDLYTRRITHLHMPSLEDPGGLSRDLGGVRQVACWSRDGNRFCVPCLGSLHLADFSPSPHAGCSVSAIDPDNRQNVDATTSLSMDFLPTSSLLPSTASRELIVTEYAGDSDDDEIEDVEMEEDSSDNDEEENRRRSIISLPSSRAADMGREATERGGGGGDSHKTSARLRHPPAVTVPLTAMVTCAAVHPMHDVILAGTCNDKMVVVAQR